MIYGSVAHIVPSFHRTSVEVTPLQPCGPTATCFPGDISTREAVDKRKKQRLDKHGKLVGQIQNTDHFYVVFFSEFDVQYLHVFAVLTGIFLVISGV